MKFPATDFTQLLILKLKL